MAAFNLPRPQYTLLERIEKAPNGLALSLVSEFDAQLTADLAELQRRGLIQLIERPSHWISARNVSATVTVLGRTALQHGD